MSEGRLRKFSRMFNEARENIHVEYSSRLSLVNEIWYTMLGKKDSWIDDSLCFTWHCNFLHFQIVVHETVTEHLLYKNTVFGWVPKTLLNINKTNQLLHLYTTLIEKGNGSLKKIVTGDIMWFAAWYQKVNNIPMEPH